MSERPRTHAVAGGSSQSNDPEVARPTLTSAASTPTLSHFASVGEDGPTPHHQRPSLAPLRGLDLPPLSQQAPASAGGPPPPAPRIAGVASILNPMEEQARTGHRRKISQLESPIAPAPRLPALAANLRNDLEQNTAQGLSPGPTRRILTPRSPSGVHRTASLGQLRPRGVNIDAQQTPFPPSPHRHTIEPGRAGIPPLPSPSAMAQAGGYGFPVPQAQSNTARRASTGTNRARNLSSSASPSTSYSSYSQAGQTSPASRYASMGPAPLMPSYGASADLAPSQQRKISDSAGSETQRQMGIPISSSGGQNVYQMMTLETTSGTVQLPVDVQAASRVADEKRRRNAGASARFRQRRKEKEREASTSIARLEQQVKELSEEVDFYRTERAGLLSLLRSVPGMEQQLQRPPSPQQLRGSISSMTSRRTSYMRPSEPEQQSPELSRNVRRRTSTFSLPPSTQLPPPPGPPMQPSYTPTSYNPPLAPQPPSGTLPPLIARPQGQSGSGAPPMQPQPGSYSAYGGRRPEPSPREGR